MSVIKSENIPQSAVILAVCNCFAFAFAVGIRTRGGRPFTSIKEEITISLF